MKKDYPIQVGKETYSLRFDFDAITAIEDLTSFSFAEVWQKFVKGSFSCMKLIFFGGLRANHSEVKYKDVGAILNQVSLSKTQILRNAIAVALNDAFADDEDESTKKKEETEKL